ncbi:MAG: TOBE domain-containing protein [Spirulinaceae cyanobacterium SM2_1_0]|nr:TOBE domain-containing protein [Spirulinaceae cyanobacterium SM2_1_0]
MKLSARNMLDCTVKSVTTGAVNAEVTLTLSDGQELVSVVTLASAEALDLQPGKAVKAILKASNVMLAVE